MCCVGWTILGGAIGAKLQEWAVKINLEKSKGNQAERESFQNRIKLIVAKILLACSCKQERPLSVKLSVMGLTLALTWMTTVVIKRIFHIPSCGLDGPSSGRAMIMLAGSAVVGIIYSLGINVLLNRYVWVAASKETCCSHRKI